MATKELKEKYGEGNTRQIINRAIGNELPGGNEVIDALTIVIRNVEAPSTRTMMELKNLLRTAQEAMESEIRTRYDMKQRER